MISMQFTWIALSLIQLASARSPYAHPPRSIYDDLVAMDAACGQLDSCRRGDRPTEDVRVVNCQCGPICARLGTCCADSEYRNVPTDEESRRIAPSKLYRSPQVVFMMSECSPDWDGDGSIKDLCDMSHNSAYRDPFLLVPVTNPRTGLTYKNFYCFVCNHEEGETLDSPVMWDIQLFLGQNTSLGPDPELKWGKWDYEVKGQEVYISIGAPEEIYPLVQWYRQDVISTCSEGWTHAATKAKCEAYTAIVYLKRPLRSPIYRNPHCALCNNANVSELVCTEPAGNEVWGGPPFGFQFVGLFSLEDKVSRCPRDQVFDKYAKRCRAYRCARSQKVEGGKCTGGSRSSETVAEGTQDQDPSFFKIRDRFQWRPPPRTPTAS